MTNEQLLELADVRDQVRTGAARAIREGAGLSLAEVARAIGVSPTTVHRWERAERSPHGEAALRYRALLEDLSARRRPGRARR